MNGTNYRVVIREDLDARQRPNRSRQLGASVLPVALPSDTPRVLANTSGGSSTDSTGVGPGNLNVTKAGPREAEPQLRRAGRDLGLQRGSAPGWQTQKMC